MPKALIIDDNPSSQLLFKELFEIRGFQLWLADSGEAGAELYQTVEPDITLLDIHLPGISGIETLRRIRKYQEMFGSVRPVVAVTAGAMLEDRNELGHAGFDAIFYKPVDIDTMIHTVEDLL